MPNDEGIFDLELPSEEKQEEIPSGFQNLPPELVHSLLPYLGSANVFSLSQTSRSLNEMMKQQVRERMNQDVKRLDTLSRIGFRGTLRFKRTISNEAFSEPDFMVVLSDDVTVPVMLTNKGDIANALFLHKPAWAEFQMNGDWDNKTQKCIFFQPQLGIRARGLRRGDKVFVPLKELITVYSQKESNPMTDALTREEKAWLGL